MIYLVLFGFAAASVLVFYYLFNADKHDRYEEKQQRHRD